MPRNPRTWCLTAAAMTILSWVGLAPAAVITELLTAPMVTPDYVVPSYIEIALVPEDHLLDVVILDARSGSERQIKGIWTIQPDSVDVVVIHEGPWMAATWENTLLIETDNLDFGGERGGARRIIVFNHQTGWIGTTADEPANWNGIEDVVALGIGGWAAQPVISETVLNLPMGGAAVRELGPTEYGPDYVVGSVTQNLKVGTPGIILTPGEVRTDELHANPEPGLTLFTITGAACLAARRNRRVISS